MYDGGVKVDELNLYIDSLMAIAKKPDRELLIELAEQNDNLKDLLRDWLWEQDRGSDATLELKNLFQLRYEDLGEIFNLSFKEVTQLLRTQRAAALGAYLKREDSQAGGISCFLVDQLLSPWVDSEWDNLSGMDKLGEHLRLCPSCRHRLQDYRELNGRILARREPVELMSQEEWAAGLKKLRQRRRKQRLKVSLILILILGLIAGLSALILKQPEKTPNVYEITE